MHSMTNDDLLQTFHERTYYGEDTVVVDALGNVERLEGYVGTKFLENHQFLLFRRAECSPSEIRGRLAQFVTTLRDNLTAHAQRLFAHTIFLVLDYDKYQLNDQPASIRGPAIVAFMRDTLQTIFSLTSRAPELEALMRAYLQSPIVEDGDFRPLFVAFAEHRIKQAIVLLQDPQAIGNKMQMLVNRMPDMAQRHARVEQAITAILGNRMTRPAVRLALSEPELRIFIIDDLKACNKMIWKRGGYGGSTDFAHLGFADAAHQRIFVCHSRRLASGPYTLFGGIDLERDLRTANPHYKLMARTSLLQLMVEEFSDYTGVKYLGKNDETYLRLRQSLATIQPALKAQHELAKLILTGKERQLDPEQRTLWEHMKAVVNHLRAQITTTPRWLIRAVSPGEPASQRIIHQALETTFRRVKEIDILDLDVPAGKRLMLYEAPAIGVSLSDHEIVSMFSVIKIAMEDRINDLLNLYGSQRWGIELAGKLLSMVIEYPDYLAQVFPSLHEELTQISLRIDAVVPTPIVCQEDNCEQNTAEHLASTGSRYYGIFQPPTPLVIGDGTSRAALCSDGEDCPNSQTQTNASAAGYVLLAFVGLSLMLLFYRWLAARWQGPEEEHPVNNAERSAPLLKKS